ncbi:MAG TPA: YggS family pyridoxal phosphate-dependent enzyme [Microbacteriaceae bacterium]
MASVRSRISEASKASNRPEPTLVVVTKNHPVQMVEDLYELGERDFGENRDQEASAKAGEFNPAESDYRWHFIGQLQSNKVRSVMNYASVLHSLDRPSLLKELAKREAELEVFIQMNLTDDPNRGGVNPSDLEQFAQSVLEVPSLNLVGVMAVGGLDVEPEQEFERVRAASEKLKSIHPEANQISAGMSGDFEQAIAYGATHLRIGSLITGNSH